MKKLALIASFALLATGAQAQSIAADDSKFYVEGGYSTFTLAGGEDSEKTKMGILRLTGGYQINPNFSVEGMFGLSAKKQTGSYEDAGLVISTASKAKSVVGLFVKGQMAVTDGLELYGRLGTVNTKLEYSESALGLTISAADSESSMSWGVGAKYAFSKQVYGAADYTSYYKKDGVKIDGLAFSLGYRF